jgi:MoaD family protein
MTVTVKIPSPLRPMTGGQSEVRVEGATVGEVLRQLDAQYKGFGERVMDDKGVRRFINIFVNEDNIRDRKDLDTELKAGDTVSILPSIAGGSGQPRLRARNLKSPADEGCASNLNVRIRI